MFMRCLSVAVLGLALALAATHVAQAAQRSNTGSLNLTGSILIQNACTLEMTKNSIDLGEHHYKNLNANQVTTIFDDYMKFSVLAIRCHRPTPLALKFSTTGTQPVVDGKYHSLTLAEVGDDVKQNVAYADIKITSFDQSRFLLSGHLDDPFDIPSAAPMEEALIHGFPNSPSEPERSGITLTDRTGKLAQLTEAEYYFTAIAYAAPTDSWKESIPEESAIPLKNTLVITAVYL
jgi:type 1 fimbria pilin